MCDDDLDTILSYLSSKINKIFCDREFVGCVKEDFDVILRNAGNNCVVFPKLKPIFLKVLRYQAVLFDLSVFCIGSGRTQLAVVCKKSFLKEQFDESPLEENKEESKAMDGEEDVDKTHSKKSNRTNRPTQTYYVPPAQRTITRKKVDHENNKTSNTARRKSKSKHKDIEKQLIETKDRTVDSNVSHDKIICEDNMQEEPALPNNLERVEFADSTSQLPSNNIEEECGTSLDFASLPNYKELEECGAGLDVDERVRGLSLFDSSDVHFSKSDEKVKSNECVESLPQDRERQFYNLSSELVQNKCSCDEDVRTTMSNTSLAACDAPDCVDHSINVQKPQLNLPSLCELMQENQNVQNSVCGNSEKNINELYKIELDLHDSCTPPDSILQQCTKNPKLYAVIENLRIQQGTNKISLLSGNEDVEILNILERIFKKEDKFTAEVNGQTNDEVLTQKLLTDADGPHLTTAAADSNYTIKNSDVEVTSFSLSNNVDDVNSYTNPLLIIPPPLAKTEDVSDFCSNESKQLTNGNSICSHESPLYIGYNDDLSKRKTVECDTDNENEEMQRVIENINRKSRSLIKHNIRNVNTLRIEENEHAPHQNSQIYENNKTCSVSTSETNSTKEDHNNLSNWEDLFDETGGLQQEYIGKIVKRVGCDVQIVKASHDYSAYENIKYQDLEHVIELYDFPSTFKTQDLIQLYRGASQDPMYVKWCDDTHALLVLSTPAQAQRALQIKHEVIKSRPLSQASSTAAVAASGADLKPAMKRPQTNMQTARRLITTHLGTKSTLSKEEVEQERQALRDARELRRQERQNEQDAWEGRPKSAKSHLFF